MNVASLELCKELHELSGWKGIYGPYADVTYDLGYLLRELPAIAKTVNGFPYHFFLHKNPDNTYHAGYQNSIRPKHDFFQYADTPEDAAAKLAIELLKSGVLTSENQGLSKASSESKGQED